MNAHTPTPPVVFAFAWVPDFARGHVRDVRVRWALEEAGLAYATQLVGAANREAYRARQQPFGQIPAYRDGEVEMFESGAIVLHIAEQSPALMPRDPAGRARVLTWMFGALNTLEIAIGALTDIDLFNAGAAWATARRPAVEAHLRKRLGELAVRLGDSPHLDGETFTAGDLLMASVLRDAPPALLAEHPNLAAYLERCLARPAFQKAVAAQLADFSDTPN
jgi:glutathione S-transferase